MQHSSIWLHHAHDVRLVLIAAFVCGLSAMTVFTILERARGAAKHPAAWLALAGTVSGVGIWSTHFIAMLSYDPGVALAFDPVLTLLSAVMAVVVTGVGWALAIGRGRLSAILGGCVVAAGISTMHYTGMAAVKLPGRIEWDYSVIGASILACIVLSVWSVHEHRRRLAIIPWRAAGVLVIAICALHFGGMAAVGVTPDHGIDIPESHFDRDALLALVVSGSMLVVAIGFFVVLFDRVTDREKAAAKIAHLAYHDALTGLSNRSVLEHQLSRDVEQARSAGEPLAVICIDLDGFKAVNDSLGHAAGDNLLTQVAARLQSVVRNNELVARVGGDEFIIVQRGGAQPADSGAVAERVVEILKKPFQIFGQVVKIGASVGISLFPKDATTADELTMKADAALYRVKSSGKGGARYYDSSIEAGLKERQGLELALAAAVSNQELKLFYQPIQDVGSGSVVAFETLLRWDRPGIGAVDPELFICVAEQRALIDEIGMWVLRTACTDALSWEAPLTVCVNFSPVQFLRKDLADAVASVLRETGLDPHRLEIEVTENVLLTQPDEALCIFNDLKALGIRISLDDFGTGYSSLSYFRVYPFDKVKIDRSFVSNLDCFSSKEIVRSVIDLSRSLGITVVAEGVETTAQLDTLRQLGCAEVQGYLIGRPQPLENFAKMVLGTRTDARAA